MDKLDSRLPVTLRSDNSLSIPCKGIELISYKNLGHMIREGHSIVVHKYIDDGQAIDVTDEVLVRVAAFPEERGRFSKKVANILNMLETAAILKDDMALVQQVLYLIIENGGLKSYVQRKAKGMVVYEQL